MLGDLGIAPTDELAYRALLRHGSADLAELSRLTKISTGTLRRVVARLEDEGLVSRLTGRRLRLVATSPHVAIEAIAARREEEIARARSSVSVLADETHHRSASPPEELLEIVTGQGAVVVHQSTLLDALIVLFEMMWRAASPLRWIGQGAEADDRLSGVDVEILSLLSAGLKDETVARQVGMSLRTLQRRTSELFDVFGARTRFQAGYSVSREGILED